MKVLITGGATWVKVDSVRIFTNIFTGKTSVYLASYFARNKCKVTLLLNTHCIDKLPKDIKTVPFRYFDDLKRLLINNLKQNKYNLVIHTAAISDYLLKHSFKGKVPSGKNKFKIELTAAPKLTNIIRHYAKGAYLVQFKLEALKGNLIDKARRSLIKNKFDAVVANSLDDLSSNYQAFIINRKNDIKKVRSIKELAKTLFNIGQSA